MHLVLAQALTFCRSLVQFSVCFQISFFIEFCFKYRKKEMLAKILGTSIQTLLRKVFAFRERKFYSRRCFWKTLSENPYKWFYHY